MVVETSPLSTELIAMKADENDIERKIDKENIITIDYMYLLTRKLYKHLKNFRKQNANENKSSRLMER